MAIPLLVALGPLPRAHQRMRPDPAALAPVESAYRHAVDLYRAGDTAAAFDGIKRLPRDQIDDVLTMIEERRREHGATAHVPGAFAWRRVEVLAAGMLEGDVALSGLDSGAAGLHDALPLALKALRIADSPQADMHESPETWTRDWLRAAASLLLTYGLVGPTRDVLESGRTLFPDDGPLLLTRGMLGEFESTAPANSSHYFYLYRGMLQARDAREQELKIAADAFERALGAMPDSKETRTRLAHVDIALGHESAAIPLLEKVQGSDDPEPAYLAALMLGDIRARQAKVAEAETDYRGAIATSGGAQSAFVSLSMLQYSVGRRADAAATLDDMYARNHAAPVFDPWWSYWLGTPEHPRALLDALRAEARR
jgi:tetratricopeptide (TPR) repeat protein